MSAVKRFIRKTFVQAFDLGNSSIPKAEVEVYARDCYGETFYLPTLYEGIQHLLSNEGYRLSVWEWPDGADLNSNRFGFTIRRDGNDIAIWLEADCLDLELEGNKIKFRLEEPSPQKASDSIPIVLVPCLPDEISEQPPVLEELAEVIIDGN